MLTSLLDPLSAVFSPAPSATPVPSQSARSGTPVWVALLVGLLGGVLGGAGAFGGAWRSSGALRQNTERTLEHERTRLLNERFSTAAELLGHDEAACRLAGVHAMAGLADDWTERRQTCIDVLCAYLRMPYTPAVEAPNGQANREVRLTAIRAIRDHLLPDTPPETSWSGYDLDFTGAVFDGGDFSKACFSGGRVSFVHATFTSDYVLFSDATFSGGKVLFSNATFSGLSVFFDRARFSGSNVYFNGAEFSGGGVSFDDANFSSGIMNFLAVRFSGSRVRFGRARFSGTAIAFPIAEFSDGAVKFDDAVFTDGVVRFPSTRFSGAVVTFHRAQFEGGVVDMRDVGAWSRPPSFDDGLLATPPSGLLLPEPLPGPDL